MADTIVGALTICVVDGRANFEIVPDENSGMTSDGELAEFVCLEEGESLTVEIALSTLDLKVEHPDLDFLIENHLVDPGKVEVQVTPPKVQLKLTKGALCPT